MGGALPIQKESSMTTAAKSPALPAVLTDPLRNHGVAFTPEQRRELGLVGRLPSGVLSLEDQAHRAYRQLKAQPTDLARNVYLEQLRDRNETLFFKLLTDHVAELLPIVYAPTVGDAIQRYSLEYRRPRGLFLSIDAPQEMKQAFQSLDLGPADVDLIVCTDAEEILGIGDWGVGGIEISLAKLAVYTAAAGIDPRRVIAVSLDVGTDNETLLNDPLYLGNRHARRRGAEYDGFIAAYLETASRLFPDALLHFEDFGPGNARRILEQYADRYRVFNDDLQGTAAITLAGLLAAVPATCIPMRDQRLVVFGAGTAGVGIADCVRDAMIRDGASPEQATAQVWLIDKPGLLTDATTGLRDYQQPYARPAAEVAGWTADPTGAVSLLETIKRVQPTVLVGTSTVHGAFTEELVRAMTSGTQRPIILPLSNPTSRIEAMPADILSWSDGKALVATGIPVSPVLLNGIEYRIGQANNALLFPGLGLGAIVCRATKITGGMLIAAARAIAEQVDPSTPGAAILPPISDLRASSARVALATIAAAQADGVATATPHDPVQAVLEAMWQPVYDTPPTRRT
jgi:malate dehydrogenase (oxaloacetate-decarboxylating)